MAAIKRKDEVANGLSERRLARSITEGKYQAVPRDIWLSAFGNILRNRFLPQRASTQVASICSPFVAEVRIATRNVVARQLIEGLLVSRPTRYGPSGTEQPALGFFALD